MKSIPSRKHQISILENVGEDGPENPEDPSKLFENLEYEINIFQKTRNGNVVKTMKIKFGNIGLTSSKNK